LLSFSFANRVDFLEPTDLEITREVFVHRTHVELRIANAQKVDGLGLRVAVVFIDFGKFAQKVKGQDRAQMRFDFQMGQNPRFWEQLALLEGQKL
jgi:hypothetical protein